MTASSIKVIQTLRRKAGMDDDTYRDFLALHTGKRSSKELDEAQADRVIGRLRAIVPDDRRYEQTSKSAPSRRPSERMDGPFAGKLRALWLTAYNLGLVENRDDRALIAFVQRQTGVTHARFLIEPQLAAKAIEGVKAIISRAHPELAKPLVERDPMLIKRAVVAAQHLILARLGVDPISAVAGSTGAASAIDGPTLDRVQIDLGRQIRAAKVLRKDRA